ncbi:MAG: patatin-like phospholipase family protein [Thermoanaerobaculia bacterium]|nr:patatin-like phospholipase family protein [Thermoanaerobaculia bacterium]
MALSGGGSRAIAFHLGCLRALHDRGILDKVAVLSGVSGGSVIAALYAYSDEPFEAFARRVEATLSRGMVWGIAREAFLSSELPKIVVATVLAGAAASVARTLQLLGWLLSLVSLPTKWVGNTAERILDVAPRFASFTTAFERHLVRRYFGDRRMDAVGRRELSVVINAAELRTETAFRYGSIESGCWRFGRLTETPRVATAVAASAAFPAFLPALDHYSTFTKGGVETKHRAIITDGGVYDNLGVSCMLPGRSSEFSTNALPVDFIIACDAGQGTPTGARRPTFWMSRMLATLITIHRRTQTMTQNLLHRMAANGEIQGFLMPYLGQWDNALPLRPADLVTRDEVIDYPTNFNPMSRGNVEKLGKRGEQLTRCLTDAYAPYL